MHSVLASFSALTVSKGHESVGCRFVETCPAFSSHQPRVFQAAGDLFCDLLRSPWSDMMRLGVCLFSSTSSQLPGEGLSGRGGDVACRMGAVLARLEVRTDGRVGQIT